MFWEHMSWLQMFWGAQTVAVGAHSLFLLATGGYWDKSQGDRSPDDPVGKLQFRKRVWQYVLIGAVSTSWLLWNVVWTNCAGAPPSERLAGLLDLLAEPRRQTSNNTGVLLALMLYEGLVFRRMYENMKISIFSGRHVINPLELLLSLAYPVAAGLSILADAPLLGSSSECFSFSNISWLALFGLPLYFLGSNMQHSSLKKLARMRKNRAGHIVTTSYKMPKGDWFDDVSSPHYFGEVLCHLSVGLCLGLHSVTFWWHIGYVVVKHFFLAYNTHVWYLRKFEDYPSDRKMLIPYLL